LVSKFALRCFAASSATLVVFSAGDSIRFDDDADALLAGMGSAFGDATAFEDEPLTEGDKEADARFSETVSTSTASFQLVSTGGLGAVAPGAGISGTVGLVGSVGTAAAATGGSSDLGNQLGTNSLALGFIIAGLEEEESRYSRWDDDGELQKRALFCAVSRSGTKLSGEGCDREIKQLFIVV